MRAFNKKEREFLLDLAIKDELPKNNEGLDKSLITDFIIKSRIEYHLLKIGDEKKLKKILGPFHLEKIKLENFKKTIPTLKNIDMSVKISKKLNNSDIKYTFLKGINCQNLSEKFIRPSRDIDLLIDIKDIPRSINIIEELGFSFINHRPFSENMITSLKGKYDLPVMQTKDGITLEIHYKIIRNQKSISCSFSQLLLKNQNKLFIGDNILPILSNEHLIVHLIYHGTQKGSFDVGLSTFIDIQRIQKRNLINWNEINSISQELGFGYYSKLMQATLEVKQNNEISKEDVESFKYLFTLPIINTKFFEIYEKKSFTSRLNEIFSSIFVKKEIILREFEVKYHKFIYIYYLRRWYRQLKLLLSEIFQIHGKQNQIRKKFKLIKRFAARN